MSHTPNTPTSECSTPARVCEAIHGAILYARVVFGMASLASGDDTAARDERLTAAGIPVADVQAALAPGCNRVCVVDELHVDSFLRPVFARCEPPAAGPLLVSPGGSVLLWAPGGNNARRTGALIPGLLPFDNSHPHLESLAIAAATYGNEGNGVYLLFGQRALRAANEAWIERACEDAKCPLLGRRDAEAQAWRDVPWEDLSDSEWGPVLRWVAAGGATFSVYSEDGVPPLPQLAEDALIQATHAFEYAVNKGWAERFGKNE